MSIRSEARTYYKQEGKDIGLFVTTSPQSFIITSSLLVDLKTLGTLIKF